MIILVGLYLEIPGPYRALTPKFYGLTDIGGGIYTDDPVKAPEIRSQVRKARDNSAAFFGRNTIEPRYIICVNAPCAETFGVQALGLAVGYHLVLLAPGGVNERTMTHERAHIDLHGLMGPADLVKPRFPHWFDEGLASHIAGDNRIATPRNARDADWVRAAQTWRQWGALVRSRSASRAYGSAARLVKEIEDTSGREALSRLVDSVANGADFTVEYESLINR